MFVFFTFLSFVYFWETESISRRGAERKRERERQNPKQAPGSVSAEPNTGREPAEHEIMAWAKVGHLSDWATQAPQTLIHVFAHVSSSFPFYLPSSIAVVRIYQFVYASISEWAFELFLAFWPLWIKLLKTLTCRSLYEHMFSSGEGGRW